jgi:hypothetical protein
VPKQSAAKKEASIIGRGRKKKCVGDKLLNGNRLRLENHEFDRTIAKSVVEIIC